jgi:hypothetical protein
LGGKEVGTWNVGFWWGRERRRGPNGHWDLKVFHFLKLSAYLFYLLGIRKTGLPRWGTERRKLKNSFNP